MPGRVMAVGWGQVLRGISLSWRDRPVEAHRFALWEAGAARLHFSALARAERGQRAYPMAAKRKVPVTLAESPPAMCTTIGQGIERAYQTHWVSPALSEAKRRQLAERQSRPADLVVVMPLKDWTCVECSGTGDMLIMESPGPLCLACADMDHLVFLPSGDATLTRCAKKLSGLSAVVVRFSRSRKRYELQGNLVEEAALDQAERERLTDEEARDRHREREEARRTDRDRTFQAEMAAEILRLFPGCPATRAEAIAYHAADWGPCRA
ncbi:MAG: DUF2293 domain-containing protein [Acidimicrobiales bacterium]